VRGFNAGESIAGEDWQEQYKTVGRSPTARLVGAQAQLGKTFNGRRLRFEMWADVSFVYVWGNYYRANSAIYNEA
jgi:hypothetical protein